MHASWIILKTGSTLPDIAARRGDFDAWILQGMGLPESEARVVPVAQGAELPPVDAVHAVIVTGSSAMVTARAAWSVRSADWLREVCLRHRPVLGICYGHQLLADALGGEVGPNQHGREIGTVEVTSTPEGLRDPLLSAAGSRFGVQATHSESVLTLPPGATLLASNLACRNQAFSVGSAWGVQFHPEFDADIVRGYITARRAVLRSEGLSPDFLLREARHTGVGSRLLRRFHDLARDA